MCSVASFSGLVEFKPALFARPQISHVVFDFDGTLSWLRHGWPEIMLRLFREHLPRRAGESRRGPPRAVPDARSSPERQGHRFTR